MRTAGESSAGVVPTNRKEVYAEKTPRQRQPRHRLTDGR